MLTDAPRLIPLAPGGDTACIEPAPGNQIVSVAFDTLKFARALRDKAHLPAEQAESIAEAFGDATGEQLATKTDLREQGAARDNHFVRIEGELALLKWMVGFNLAATVGLLFLLLRH
jgi:hypothetical protein